MGQQEPNPDARHVLARWSSVQAGTLLVWGVTGRLHSITVGRPPGAASVHFSEKVCCTGRGARSQSALQ